MPSDSSREEDDADGEDGATPAKVAKLRACDFIDYGAKVNVTYSPWTLPGRRQQTPYVDAVDNLKKVQYYTSKNINKIVRKHT